MLKTIILTTMIFSSANAIAKIQAVPEGTSGISSLKGRIVDVQPLCPENMTCVTDGTVVTLEYTLEGCLDNFADGGVYAVEEGGRLKVYASALNLHHKKSLVAFCAVMPTVKRTHSFIMKFGQVDLINLGRN